MDIEHWRKEIDEIDAELLRLLNMRARLALKVGALKQAADLPFCDPDRERTVLQRLQEINCRPARRTRRRQSFPPHYSRIETR